MAQQERQNESFASKSPSRRMRRRPLENKENIFIEGVLSVPPTLGIETPFESAIGLQSRTSSLSSFDEPFSSSMHVRRRSSNIESIHTPSTLDEQSLKRIGELEESLLLEVPTPYRSPGRQTPRRHGYSRESSPKGNEKRTSLLFGRLSRSRGILWLLTMIGITSICITFSLDASLDKERLPHLRQGNAGLTETSLKKRFVDRSPRKKKEKKDTKHHVHSDGAKREKKAKVDKPKEHAKPSSPQPARYPTVKRPKGMERKYKQSPRKGSGTYEEVGSDSSSRILYLDPSMKGKTARHHRVELYPAELTDNTQLYPFTDSGDEAVQSTMERRIPVENDECKALHEWQTTFHPSCNAIHELGLEHVGKTSESHFQLFGTKGYWRNAWRVESPAIHEDELSTDTFVLKTLKLAHRFEERHYEHDRIDAVAMERLTASPHVIDIFGFCGHSVITEFADGKNIGELADKNKHVHLKRLEIARDIASGLADIHNIDRDGVPSLVHFDINPANVVSIGGRLKFNDFNIAVMKTRNVTSGGFCDIPAHYPNPQWRSPEEANNRNDLTEKIDVFSMGHIFYRLICGHGPWNKLEPGGKPNNEVLNEKVKNGTLPFIPESVLKSKNREVVAIREAMLKCYTFDPSERPSAQGITNILQDALDKLQAET